MKIPPQNQGNLIQPSPETLRLLESIVVDIAREDMGALFWSEGEGFILKIPQPPEEKTLPIPLYLLGLCFLRLTTDASFGGELMEWADRNKN